MKRKRKRHGIIGSRIAAVGTNSHITLTGQQHRNTHNVHAHDLDK